MALLCFWVGAKSIYSIVVSTIEIWAARRKFHYYQKQHPEIFKRYLEHGKELFEDSKNATKKNDA